MFSLLTLSSWLLPAKSAAAVAWRVTASAANKHNPLYAGGISYLSEGKDVQWCLDDFFQIHEGYDGDDPLWSGPWYYRDRPEERPMHQQRIQKMEAIRSRNRNLHRFSRHFDR